MKRIVFCFVIALFFVFLPLYGKGPTLKIVISGGNLVRPIEIVDAAVLKNFNIWSGPGASPGARDVYRRHLVSVGPPPSESHRLLPRLESLAVSRNYDVFRFDVSVRETSVSIIRF